MRTVFLRHTLADGSWHIDWLLEVRAEAAARIPAFRLDRRPDEPGLARFVAERMADHRRAYLDYYGEISGGRGRVERVGSGIVLSVSGWPGRLDVSIELDAGCRHHWAGSPGPDSVWRFARVPGPGGRTD